jgi:hypothetical protein
MIVDFQNSFLEWETKENSIGRFSAEAVIFSGDKGFILGSEVLACNVYNTNDFFKKPVYKFQPLFSNHHQLIYRTFTEDNTSNDSSSFDQEIFNRVNCHVQELKAYEVIDNIEILNRAFKNEKKFQMLITINKHQLQFPVKHINVNLEESRFQIETGPVVVLDNNEFRRAFVCCGSFNYAELVCENKESRKFDLQLKLETGVTIVAS